MQQQEFFGFDSIKNLEEILKKEKSKKVFLVSGKKSFEDCGAQEIFEKYSRDYNIKRFCDFSSNPKKEEIDVGFELFKQENYDTIIAIGGGSVIDVAKKIKLSEYENSKEKILLVAIPTTSGSGSEATHFIVYYKGDEKQSEGDSKLTLPNYVICDPQFTMSLPKKITASTGIDALSQAIESYWSINSTEESKKFSEEAIKICLQNLEGAVNFSSEKNRENMMRAANLAGKAINITKTTACHSISYPITSYFQIPHGHAAGLTLGEMLVYNSKISNKDCLDKRGEEYVKEVIDNIVKMFDKKNSIQAKDRINKLMKNIGLETKLSRIGLSKDDIELIIKKGFNPDRVRNNPRLLTKDNLKKILEEIY
jgi:alcohol dehydrogenase class IV